MVGTASDSLDVLDFDFDFVEVLLSWCVVVVRFDFLEFARVF